MDFAMNCRLTGSVSELDPRVVDGKEPFRWSEPLIECSLKVLDRGPRQRVAGA